MINLSPYFKFIAIAAAFSGGWYSGYTYYNVRQLKINLNNSNQVIQYQDKLLITTKQNIDNVTKQSIVLKNQKDEVQNKLDKQIKDNANAKNSINANNIITRDLLQRVGALKTENAKLHANGTTTSRIITTNGTVPAYDYVQWAAGLKPHDDICVIKFNTIQKIYNDQMILINEFR